MAWLSLTFLPKCDKLNAVNLRWIKCCLACCLGATLLLAADDDRVPAIVSCRGAGDVAALVTSGAEIDSVAGLRMRAYIPSNKIAVLRGAGLTIAVDEDSVRRIGEIRAMGWKAAGYHSYEDMTNELTFYALTYTNLCRLVSVGKSVKNRDLWILKISGQPGRDEDEPAIRYVGSIHGDEPVGMENCLNFIGLLLSNYSHDARCTRLVDECALWVMPQMNPDGYVLARRGNWNNKDLNRDFPDRFYSSNRTVAACQPETAAMMLLGLSNTFTISANFHSGAVVVNYPYDGRNDGLNDGMSGGYVACPDDALYIAMARTYADANPSMRLSNGDAFTNGICNGAQWYCIYGGMQDWNYVWPRCFEVTIELDNNQPSLTNDLPALWAENVTSMLAYAEWALRGVRGSVTDNFSGQPIAAMVTVSNCAQAVFTNPDVGDYHRMLLPGTYALSFSAGGYYPETVPGIVVTNGPATRVDVGLTAVPEPMVGCWLLGIGWLVSGLCRSGALASARLRP